MKIPDIASELKFQTSRSGGKGGQNVNKVETAVMGLLDIDASGLLTDEQKSFLRTRLSNRINAEGILQVRSDRFRSQLANKQEVTQRMQELIALALQPRKKRVPTRPGRSARENRLKGKKIHAERKASRRKYRPGSE